MAGGETLCCAKNEEEGVNRALEGSFQNTLVFGKMSALGLIR